MELKDQTAQTSKPVVKRGRPTKAEAEAKALAKAGTAVQVPLPGGAPTASDQRNSVTKARAPRPPKGSKINLPENFDTMSDAEKAAFAAPRTPEQFRMGLRKLVRNLYDYQRLRIQASGRVQKRAATAPPVELHPADKLTLAKQSLGLEAIEKSALVDVTSYLKENSPFYVRILSNKDRYKGIGPTLAGVILSEFDIVKAERPSQFWAYAGLSVIPARRCKHCHTLMEVVDIGRAPIFLYAHKKSTSELSKTCPIKASNPDNAPEGATYESGYAMRLVRGQKSSYNTFLRAKMCGVMADTLIRAQSPWARYYYAYKHRKETANWGTSQMHRDRAAKRYMVKMVLLQVWLDWRKALGLPIVPSYHEAKQGGHGYQPGDAPSNPFDEIERLPPLPVKKTTPDAALTPAERQEKEDQEDVDIEVQVTAERMAEEPSEPEEVETEG